MTEEEREKLINDMEIAILKEGVGTILHSSQLSRMALAALAVAEEAISTDYRARIAELEAALTPLAEMDYWIEPHHDAHDSIEQCNQLTVAEILVARAALNGEK